MSRLFKIFPPEVRTFFSPRPLNFSLSGSTARYSSRQRSSLQPYFPEGIPRIAALRQTHGSQILIIKEGQEEGESDDYPEGDGLLTHIPGVALTVRTADCLPVFLCDPVQKAVGIVHAGWKGTSKGIVSKAVRMMQEGFGSSPADIRAGLGPGIRSCCYAVGSEFQDVFPGQLEARQGQLFLDLAGANLMQLLAAGVTEQNVEDVRQCTCCQPDYYSFRRQGKAAGRHLALIILSGDKGL